jgi:hypothetical protein
VLLCFNLVMFFVTVANLWRQKSSSWMEINRIENGAGEVSSV